MLQNPRKPENRKNKMAKNNLGLVRVGVATPALKVADTTSNAENIMAIIRKAEEDKTGILVLPELTLTGCTCGDLFFQDTLYQAQLEALANITTSTAQLSIAVICGCYIKSDNTLYDCAAVIQRGNILGIVPKALADSRHFASAADVPESKNCIRLFGRTIPFGSLIFEDEQSGLNIGIEIGSDIDLPVSPGSLLALSGADIIVNPASDPEMVESAAYRRQLVTAASLKSTCAYLYASAGCGESTSDMLYSGHCLIAENGKLLAESSRLEKDNRITYSEIDFGKIDFERVQTPQFRYAVPSAAAGAGRIKLLPLTLITPDVRLSRRYSSTPFIPDSAAEISAHCSEIFDIQTKALAARLSHVHAKKAVVGISGGLDSTLALLVSSRAMEILGRPSSDIIAITMPGFGTTDHTYNNALMLMNKLGCDVREISIAASVRQHFADIGHNEEVHDITYENSQARERTQILMDVANKEGGFVVGTGDLSEAALGWCTFNGDHISMYNVNCGVPKTLLRHIVRWVKDNHAKDQVMADTLQSILDTPISPELLPPDEAGNIAQKTEENVGPYDLNDFFLYYTLRYGMTPAKLAFIARQAFSGTFDGATIDKWLRVFYRRFFTQQFKRNCVPDGPKVGTVGLSPRGDWQMPSDAQFRAWIGE